MLFLVSPLKGIPKPSGLEVIVVVWWGSAWLGLALQAGLGILLWCWLKTHIGCLLYIRGTACWQKGQVAIF